MKQELRYGRRIAAHLDQLLDVVRAAGRVFEAAPARPSASEAPVRRVLEAVEANRLEPSHRADEAAQVPACRNLDVAIASARLGGGEVAALADAIDDVAASLAWRTRGDAEQFGPEFVAGHADARILRSVEGDRDIIVGLSLLAPRVRYPDHAHPPEEVYAVLGSGEWWHEGGTWHEPGPGGVVHTPPGAVHAMRSSAQPLLAVWFQVDASLSHRR
jgi:quercetin dioxygenase-like cupin family protein